MLKKSGEAGASAAPTSVNIQSGGAYLKAESLSSLQSEIGELLWCLEFPIGRELALMGWGLFERLLRRYVDGRAAPHSGSESPESTKGSQRVAR